MSETQRRPKANDSPREPAYRLWVNETNTIYVRLWGSGQMEFATREQRDDIWGPPVRLEEESI